MLFYLVEAAPGHDKDDFIDLVGNEYLRELDQVADKPPAIDLLLANFVVIDKADDS